MEILPTGHRTVFVEGIEYNEYPPPSGLIKAMKRQWALPLLHAGSLKMRKLAFYQQLEKPILGDPEEGVGLLKFNGQTMRMHSMKDIYVWCTSLPSITPARFKNIAEEGNYDCLVRIHDPLAFITRICKCLRQYHRGFNIHCGRIIYNRREEVDQRTLHSQKWNSNIFQKSPRSKADQEFRISVQNCTDTPLPVEDLDLTIGNCSDIISIENILSVPFQ